MFSRLQIGTSNEKPISCQSGAAITSYHHTCAAAYHHEHGGVGSYSLVVEVNAHDGITPERLRPLHHLAHGSVLGLAQHLLVRAAASAEEVTHASHEILHKVCANNSLGSVEI